MQKILTIEGDSITDIPSFYAQINAIFMQGEDWVLANSLDALDDLFYGGYGTLKGEKCVTLIWKNIETSRVTLGYEVTRAFYENKLQYPEKFNVKLINQQLNDLKNGTGKTYFDIVLEIIASHPNIEFSAQ
ncbi:ribonuclease inhibitor [[Pantoea] beijingensis]|uniref:Ribonuclease inhibitor n=1 Tax=[Pantoea] beijingensis TaxID=1324864 RepID=A0A443III4_9GAMM|nr:MULTISPECIES: ribonuclease inhibitor [Erwiniaceae]RWR03821.1 ribonuclease inhibitor [[Pantoea] beijingensis]